MPQIDKASFFSIVMWTCIIYSLGYLFLSTTAIFTFTSSTKLLIKRLTTSYTLAQGYHQLRRFITFFPLISL